MNDRQSSAGHGLRIQKLSKAFPSNGNGPLRALCDFDVDIAAGEFVVVVGPNGSGKTTLLNLLAGDLQPDSGSIELVDAHEAADWTHLPPWKRAEQLARVHQDPRLGTAAGMTVWENIRLVTSRSTIPLPLRHRLTMSCRNGHIQRLARLGLAAKIDSRVADLSQGQRQLLAVELAMLRKPSILLLDEHTASLDQANARGCLDATVQLSRENATTVVMVTHNLMDALTYGDRLLILRDGRLAEDLTAEDKASLELNHLLALCGYVL